MEIAHNMATKAQHGSGMIRRSRLQQEERAHAQMGTVCALS